MFGSVFILVIITCLGCSSCGPRSYDDCVLKNVTEGMTKEAAFLVMSACRDKFPSKRNLRSGERDLTQEELRMLTGRAGISYGNHYSGSIYNGNSHVELSQIEIMVQTITPSTDDFDSGRPYRDDVSIAPRTAGDFGFDIIIGEKGDSYNWSIIGARGYPVGE